MKIIARAVIAACTVALMLGAVGMIYAATLATYSGNYALDLEQKQMILNTIREDAEQTEKDLRNCVDNLDKTEMLNGKTGRYWLKGDEIAEIIPSARRIYVASATMSGTLSPEPNAGMVRQVKKGLQLRK